MPAAVTESNYRTFSAFEGTAEGDAIKGVSLIQEGPAIGHGEFVDGTTLKQVKASAVAKGRVKAKINHWSGIEHVVGYFDNFRIRQGKLLGDLNLFDVPERDRLLQMVENIPAEFGVSIVFASAAFEEDPETGNRLTRVSKIYSADFVDFPAANRDGVFSGIDSGNNVMATNTPAAESAAESKRIEALETANKELAAKLDALTAKLDAKPEAAPAATVETLKPEKALSAEDISSAVATAIKAAFAEERKLNAADPVTSAAPVTPQAKEEPEKKEDKPDAYEQAKKLRDEAIGDATGYERTRRAIAFRAAHPVAAAMIDVKRKASA